MTVRRYLPTTLPNLARDWRQTGPEVSDEVLAEDDSEDSEYAALMTAAERSGAVLAE